MIARLKAAHLKTRGRKADIRIAEDVLGVVALFALLFATLAMPAIG